jgi:DNA polymerase-1
MKIAMNRVNERLEKDYPNARLLLQIHDELLIEAPEADKEAIGKLLSDEMTNAVKLSVPLSVDVMYGYDWYEVH